MLKRHHLDFEILNTGNPKTIVFLDSSEYMEKPERPLLEVTPPGYGEYFLVNIVAQKVNTLNSNTIGIHAGYSDLLELADGVWTFKYKVCPYEKVFIQKSRLRTVKLDAVMRKIYRAMNEATCDFANDAKIKKEIVDLSLLIEAGKAEAEDGCPSKASEFYQRACKRSNRLLEKLNGCC